MERDLDKLKRWIIKKRLAGQPVTAICVQARISRKMFYYWWNRYEARGWKGLEEKQRGSARAYDFLPLRDVGLDAKENRVHAR